MTQKDVFIGTVERFWGTPYKFGGSTVKGIDCSGLVVEGLKSVGIMGVKEDATAQSLWERFFARFGEAEHAQDGTLAFWFDADGLAYHVAVCLDDFVCLSADGGSSKIVTPEVADAVNAYVKIRPILHRKTAPKFVHIFDDEGNYDQNPG